MHIHVLEANEYSTPIADRIVDDACCDVVAASDNLLPSTDDPLGGSRAPKPVPRDEDNDIRSRSVFHSRSDRVTVQSVVVELVVVELDAYI